MPTKSIPLSVNCALAESIAKFQRQLPMQLVIRVLLADTPTWMEPRIVPHVRNVLPDVGAMSRLRLPKLSAKCVTQEGTRKPLRKRMNQLASRALPAAGAP